MSKAYFPCARCSASVTITEINRRSADNRANYLKSTGALCDACKQADRDAENALVSERNAERNREAGLPVLTGSLKQISWAETIRARIISEWETTCTLFEVAKQFTKETLPQEQWRIMGEKFPHYSHSEILELFRRANGVRRALGKVKRISAAVNILKLQSKSSWWIDHRGMFGEDLATELLPSIKTIEEAEIVKHEEVAVGKEVIEESYIKPDNAVSELVAEVRLLGNIISVTYPEYDVNLVKHCKKLGMKWCNRAWQKTLTNYTGDPVDRLAEIAHTLVREGYIVSLHHEDARERATSGSFGNEPTRWITKCIKGDFIGWAMISWRKTDDLYNAARSIPGSKYKSGCVYAPPGVVEAVADFAEKYEFSLSSGFKDMLAAHRAALETGAVVTNVREAPTPIVGDYSGVPKALATPTDIDIAPDLEDN